MAAIAVAVKLAGSSDAVSVKPEARSLWFDPWPAVEVA